MSARLICCRCRCGGYPAGPAGRDAGWSRNVTYSTVRRFSVLCWLAFVLCVLLPRSANAQQVWIRAYENEEDLWESYREGEITIEQYSRLVGIFRVGADSLFQPISDIDELPGGLDSATVAEGPANLPRSRFGVSEQVGLFAGGRCTVRWGGTLPLREQADEEGYFTGCWRSSLLSLFIDARASSAGPDGFRKRGLALSLPGGRIRMMLGNFEPRFGLGLVVGRRDRLLGRTQDCRPTGSIWQPQYSSYNGLQLTRRMGTSGQATVLGSRIESGVYREDIVAANVSLDRLVDNLSLGFSGVASTVLSRETDRCSRQNGMGLSFFRHTRTHKASAEFALSDGGATAAAFNLTRSLGKGRVNLSVWTYDTDYILPSSGGPGHPGRQRAAMFVDDLDFYSRTTGEQGLLINTRTSTGRRTTVEAVCEIYNDRLAATKNLEGKLGVQASLPRATTLWAYVRGRDTRGADAAEYRLYYGVRGRTRVFGEVGTAWRWEYGTIRKSGAGIVRSMRLDLSVTLPISTRVRMAPRWRYLDPDLSVSGDSYYYFYLTEGITIAPECRLEVIAVIKRYENSPNDNYADIRVRMSWCP